MKTTTTNEWRTFDEAPKDGTVVLGSDGIFYKWHTRKGSFRKPVTGWFDCNPQGNDCDSSDCEGYYIRDHYWPNELPYFWTIFVSPNKP